MELTKLKNGILAPIPVRNTWTGFLGTYTPEEHNGVIELAEKHYLGNKKFRTKNWNGRVIDTPEALKSIANILMTLDAFAFDTEFTSLKMRAKGYAHLTGVSISFGKYHNYYIPIRHWYDEADNEGEFNNVPIQYFRKIMQPVFDRTDYTLVGYNLKAELHILANEGITVATPHLYDGIIAIHNLFEDEKSKSMKEIVHKFYGYDQKHFDEIAKTVPKHIHHEYLDELGRGDKKQKTNLPNASMTLIRLMAPYAMDDTYWTWRIWEDTEDYIEEEGIHDVFYGQHMKYIRTLFNMERRGLKIDVPRLHEMRDKAEEELKNLEYELIEKAGVQMNVGSGEQLAQLIYGWKKKKPIYQEIEIPLGGEYKSGPRKGMPKVKVVKNKDKILGYEYAFNPELIDNAYNFKVIAQSDTGIPSTDAKTLGKLLLHDPKKDKRKQEGIEFIKLYLKYARLQKLKSAFLDGMLLNLYPDGRMHSSFNQTGTTSGRLSCSEVNLQQMPRPIEEGSEDEDYWRQFEIRSLMISDDEEEYVLLAHDFSNLEVRIATHFSQDPLLISMFKEGFDLHGDTAKNMFKLDCHPNEVKKLHKQKRNQAKVINFLLLYGGSPSALADSLQIPKKEAQVLFDLYFATYKGMAKMMRDDKKFTRQHEYTPTVLGRKRHLEGINSGNKGIASYNERLATNAKIQGSAADIAISAQNLIETDEFLIERGCYQLVQVHDEIVSHCPKKYQKECEERIQYLMSNCLPTPLENVELVVDYDAGYTYADAK